MTADEIMALADEYADARVGIAYGKRPCNAFSKSRAALRAAVEQIVADRDRWRQISETQSDSIYRMTVERAACDKYLKEGETPAERMERDHLDSLALMGLLAKEKERAERAEAELARIKGEADQHGMDADEQARLRRKAEAERDALRALLNDTPVGSEFRSDWELWLKRRDAVLESMK